MADPHEAENSAASSSPETYLPARSRWSATTFLGRFVPVALVGLLGLLAALPQQGRLVDHLIAQGGLALPPRGMLVLISLLQPVLLILVFAALGAALAQRYQLLSLIGHRRGWAQFQSGLPTAIISGVLLGLVFVLGDLFIFRPLDPGFFARAAAFSGSPLQSLLPGVTYGAVTEEIMARWGLLSVFCWMGCRFAGTQDECSPVATWYAIVLSALFFALGHLPAAQLLGPLAPAMLFRIIALNAMAGVVFGWLFRRYTLESAMVSHACVHGVIFLAAIMGLV